MCLIGGAVIWGRIVGRCQLWVGGERARYLRGKMLEGDQSVNTVIVPGHPAFGGLFSPPPVV